MAEPQAPDVPAASSRVERTREHLRGFLAPIIEEREQHVQRIAQLEAELAGERESLRLLDSVVSRLNGTPAKPGPKGSKKTMIGGKAINEDQIQRVRSWIEDHPDALPAEFSTGDVHRAMREEQPISGDTVSRAVRTLHARGVFTATRSIRGGHKLYSQVGG